MSLWSDSVMMSSLLPVCVWSRLWISGRGVWNPRLVLQPPRIAAAEVSCMLNAHFSLVSFLWWVTASRLLSVGFLVSLNLMLITCVLTHFLFTDYQNHTIWLHSVCVCVLICVFWYLQLLSRSLHWWKMTLCQVGKNISLYCWNDNEDEGLYAGGLRYAFVCMSSAIKLLIRVIKCLCVFQMILETAHIRTVSKVSFSVFSAFTKCKSLLLCWWFFSSYFRGSS